jgi:hypothetical protein
MLDTGLPQSMALPSTATVTALPQVNDLASEQLLH